MTDPTKATDALASSRFFAIECNNRAWDLTTKTRTQEEDQEMLNAAHAAAFHWGVAGTELNHMRAKALLAEVHALLGYGNSALAYAQEIRRYFLDGDTADWELALVHTIHAHAASAAGEPELHRRSYEQAVFAIDRIADEEERRIVLATFDLAPRP